MTTASDVDAIVKETWPERRVADTAYEVSPLLAMLPKSTDFVEKKWHIPVQIGRSGGRSADYATARTQGIAVGPVYADFEVPLVSDHKYGRIDNITIERARSGSPEMLVDAVERELKQAILSLGTSLSHELYRDGNGVLGTVASASTAATTITVGTGQAYNFEVGDEVVGSAALGGALRDSGNSATITGVDLAAGTITTDSNFGTQISGLAQNDYLYIKGDAANNGGTPLKVSGLGAWNPYGTPGALHGVTRTSFPERYAGVRLNGSSEADVKTAIIKLLTRMNNSAGSRLIAKDMAVFMHGNDFENLQIDLQGDPTYQGFKAEGADISFEAFMFNSPFGRLRVFTDKFCEERYPRVVNLKSLKLRTLGPGPKLWKGDGQELDRIDDADSTAYRANYRGNLGCTDPSTNGVVYVPA